MDQGNCINIESSSERGEHPSKSARKKLDYGRKSARKQHMDNNNATSKLRQISPTPEGSMSVRSKRLVEEGEGSNDTLTLMYCILGRLDDIEAEIRGVKALYGKWFTTTHETNQKTDFVSPRSTKKRGLSSLLSFITPRTNTMKKESTPSKMYDHLQSSDLNPLDFPLSLFDNALAPFDNQPIEDFASFESAFQNWYMTPTKHPMRTESVRLPLDVNPVADRQWFSYLWEEESLVESPQIDALLSLLLLKSKKQPKEFQSGWCILDTIAWGAICQPNLDLMKEIVRPHVQGKCPLEGSLPWGLASNVYGIAHLNENHWVAYSASFPNLEITVYDSLLESSSSSSWPSTFNLFKPLSRAIPHLWRCENLWNCTQWSTPPIEEWNVVPYVPTPQQCNAHDCGVMAIKFIECLVTGVPLSTVDPTKCPLYRRQFCAELFENHAGLK